MRFTYDSSLSAESNSPPAKTPRKIAEVLRQSLEQDNETADMIRELTSGYEERADKLN